jgi:magnesium transporter
VTSLPPSPRQRWFEAATTPSATRLLAQLSDDGPRNACWSSLDAETARWVVEYLPESQAVAAIAEIEPETAARILEELPSAEQADLIGELETEQADAILARYEEPADAEELRQLAPTRTTRPAASWSPSS